MVSGTIVVFGSIGVEAFVDLIVVLVMLLSVPLPIIMLLLPRHIHIVGQHVAAFQVISHFVGKVMGLRHLERWMLTNSRWFVYNYLLFKMWFPVVSLQFKIKANYSMLIWTALKGSFGIMVPKKGISPENGMIFQVKNSDEKIEEKTKPKGIQWTNDTSSKNTY